MTKVLLYPVVAFAWLAVAENAFVLAADIEWNQKGTVWEDPANWSTGQVPGPDDVAVFPEVKEPVKNQPEVKGTVRVGGIVFKNGATRDITLLPDYYEPAGERSFNSTGEGGTKGRAYPTRCAWIIKGAGKIVTGRNGICVAGANAVIYPTLELTADQSWEIGDAILPRSVGIDESGYPWRAYHKPLLRHFCMFAYHPRPDLILFGGISGPGGIQKYGQGSIIYIGDEQSPTFSGGTRIRDGMIMWRPPRAGDYAFGSGPVILDGGGFRFAGLYDAHPVTRLKNTIRVLSDGGEIQSRWPRPTPGAAAVQLAGDLELGGLLRASFHDPLMTFNGPHLILLQERPSTLGITDICSITPFRFAMPIIDGPGDAGNPLILQFSNTGSILSEENRYAGPTIVAGHALAGFAIGAVNVGAQARLGQGNLIVEPGGRIQLNAPGNLAPGAKALVQSTPFALGVLGVGYNGVPQIADDSAGVLAVDCDNFDAVNDLSKLGNGRMFLGSRDQGTFVGKTLAPGKDNVYRLGGGSCVGNFGAGWGRMNDLLASKKVPERSVSGGLLTIEHSVLTGNADVTVGGTGLMGLGGIFLKSAQSFTGRLTVQGPASTSVEEGFIGIGSCLEGLAQSQAGQSPFGAPTGPVHLLHSTLKLTGVPGGQPVAKGELTFTGVGTISLDAKANLTVAKLARDGRAVLGIETPHDALGATEKFFVDSWKADLDLVPPSFIFKSCADIWWRDADFLTYDATGGKGVQRFTAYVTNLAQATERDVVKVGTGDLPGGGHTVRALKVDGRATGTDRFRIMSGGLILGGTLSADVDFGAAEGLIYSSNGNNKNREPSAGSVFLPNMPAILGGTGTAHLSGKISGANGVTISGSGTEVYLSNLSNDFRGPVTVNCATFIAIQDKEENGQFTPGSLGDLRNDLVLNGANICWTAKDATKNYKRCIAPSRTIHLGPGGACLGTSKSHGSISPLYIHAKITGPGFFTQWQEAGAVFIITNPQNDYSGGTWISLTDDAGMETTVSETGKLGTGPVLVGRVAALLLKGDRNIDPGARLSIDYTGVVSCESAHPIIGSLEGTGILFLGVRSASDKPVVVGYDTTLTLGTDNTDFTFYGTIQQRGEKTGDGIGSVTKTGKGAFTFYGGHTYTGPTVVEQGTLILKGSVAGDVVVKASATFVLATSGRVGGKVMVKDGGMFQDESKNKK